jgi:hypothetical protein
LLDAAAAAAITVVIASLVGVVLAVICLARPSSKSLG